MIPAKYWSPTRKLMLLGTMAGGKAVEDTATGNPLTFLTDLARPLKSLVANFLPVQPSGTPSPENILPITGWTGVNVGRCGKNMFNGVRENGYISDSGVIGSDGYNYHSELIRVEAGEKYTYSLVKNNGSVSNKRVHGYGLDGEWVQLIKKESATQEGNIAITFTVPNGVYFIRVQFYGEAIDPLADTDIQIEQGETATTYEPFTGQLYPVAWSESGTIYGGYVDLVTGEVWATWAEFATKWKNGINAYVIGDNTRKQFALPVAFVNATTTASAYCNIAKWKWSFESDDVHFYANGSNAYVFLPNDTDGETDIQIVGQLATPVLITTLSPTQINAIIGNNTVWSDANGNCEVTYLKKG